MMVADVFLSYARSVSAGQAQAVQQALADRGISAFLDKSDIEFGARFPEAIVDALLGARVVVLFVCDAYFARRYCVWESRCALRPFEVVDARRDASPADREWALSGIVLALPEGGAPLALDRLPPGLQVTHAAPAAPPEQLVDAVDARLTRTPRTLANRLTSLTETGGAAAVRAQLLAEILIPPAQSLRGHVRAPAVFPASLGESFVGREEDLWRLDRDLHPPSADDTHQVLPADRTVVRWGVGGIGKTQLAREYLWRFGPRRFPGGLFWIDAGESRELRRHRLYDILVALNAARGAQTLAPESYFRYPDDEALRRDLVSAFDALPPDRPALVVVDSVPEPSAGARPEPLSHWCPMLGLVTVLATSRLDLRGTVAGAIGRPLDVLTPSQAISLMTEGFAGRGQLSEAEWQRIVAWVGCLPLALTLLRSMLANTAKSAVELLADADSRRPVTPALDTAMQALSGSVSAGVLRGITEAFAISFDLLPARVQRGAVLLAMLAPAPVLTVLIEVLGEPLSQDVRVALVSRSFVAPAPPGQPELFGTMHQVLADFIRTRAASPAGELAILVGAMEEVSQRLCREDQRLYDDIERAASEIAGRAVQYDHGSERVSMEELVASVEGSVRSAMQLAATASLEASQLGRQLKALGSSSSAEELSQRLQDAQGFLQLSVQILISALGKMYEQISSALKHAADSMMVPVNRMR